MAFSSSASARASVSARASGRASVAEPLPEVVVLGDVEDDRSLAVAALTATAIRPAGRGQQMRGKRVAAIWPAVAGVPEFVQPLDAMVELVHGRWREPVDATRALDATDHESAREHFRQMLGH